MSDVGRWLASLGLERYAEVFEREEITLQDLNALTDSELKDLGLPLGPRKAVLRAAAKLLNDHPAPASPLPSGAGRPGVTHMAGCTLPRALRSRDA